MSEQSNKSTARWWEYYAVRYAMGVGTGTPLVGLLWLKYRDTLVHAIHLTSPFNSAIAAILWAAIGLTYCYIASVPMLTFHTARACLKRSWWSRPRLIIFLAVLIIPSVVMVVLSTRLILGIGCAATIACIILWATMGIQLFLIGYVLIFPKETVTLYQNLEKERPRHPEVVESYRHMREHGNSVLIVLGELLLAFCLWNIHPQKPTESNLLVVWGFILAFWLLPSGLVWMVGTQLERRIAEDSWPTGITFFR